MSMKRIAVNAGGDFVPGLNAVLAGAVLAAGESRLEVVGIRSGYEGLLFPDQFPEGGLTRLSMHSVEELMHGGLGVLAASHVNPFLVRTIQDGGVEEVDRSAELLEAFRRERIDGLISVVGRRAMSVAWKLERLGLKTVCVPESAEGDIVGTVAFGFNSALSFSIELLCRVRASAQAARKIAVVEVLGERVGWLALQAGIATLADAVIIPEIPCNLDLVAEHLRRKQQNGRSPSLVVVAEGAQPVPGAESAVVAEGRLEQLRRALSPGASVEGTSGGAHVIRRSGVASDTVALGLQRRMNHDCFPLVLDKIVRGGQITAVDRQIGVAYGAAAVRGLVEGHTGEMVGIQPQHLTYVPMADSVNQVHTVPPGSEFLTTARLLGISLGAGGVSA